MASLRWPDGFRCSACSRQKAWTRSDRQFECAGCG
ncbi:MAG: transposase [Nitrospinota bacterium]